MDCTHTWHPIGCGFVCEFASDLKTIFGREFSVNQRLTCHPIGRAFVRELKTDSVPKRPWIWSWIRPSMEDWLGTRSSVNRNLTWHSIVREFVCELKTDFASNRSWILLGIANSNVKRRWTWPKIQFFSWNIFLVLNVSFRSFSPIHTHGILYKATETRIKSLRKWCQMVISN